jgi:non-ribosomal peptide synthetase component F
MTETPPNAPDLVEAFLCQAQSAPSLVAVDDGGVAVTYRELSSRAHQFAGAIQQASSGASPRVLLALPPSSSAYAAMIGSLIAGGTFCPVHLEGPEGRSAAVCRAFCPDIIFSTREPRPLSSIRRR